MHKIYALTTQQKKILNYFFKAVILIWAGVFIYMRLTDNQNLQNFRNIIADLDQKEVYGTLALIFFLMLVNWLLESYKWKFLISKIEVISLKRAIESVFCGLTWAVFTPNRIGEYGGRIFFLSARKRIMGMVAMSVGHIAQMVITNVAGALAFLWFFSAGLVNCGLVGGRRLVC